MMNEDILSDFARRGREAQLAVNKILTDHKEEKQKMGKTAPIFRTVIQTGDFILIEDLGPWDDHQTITNGVEEVILQLTSHGQIGQYQRLFYIDSVKDLAEIEFDMVDGFQRFKPCPIGGKDPTTNRAVGAWNELQKYQPRKRGEL